MATITDMNAPTITPEQIETQVSLLHGCYQKYTDLSLPLKSICDERRLAWQRFLAAGLNLEDLETVLFFLNREILAERRRRGCLRFTTLIEDINHFQEELVEARAVTRNTKPAPSPRERVLSAFSPRVSESKPTNSAEPVRVPLARVLAAMRQAVDQAESMSQ